MKKSIILIIAILLLCSCKNEKEYYCKDGILKDNKCEVITDTKEPTKECEEGYELSEEGTCNQTITINARIKYICASGYEINNIELCESVETFPKDDNRKCIVPEIEEYASAVEAKEEEGKCLVYLCKETDELGNCLETEPVEVEYSTWQSCPEGTRNTKKGCKKTYWPKITYDCVNGTKNNNMCDIIDSKDPKLLCDIGYTLNKENNKCERIEIKEANKK